LTDKTNDYTIIIGSFTLQEDRRLITEVALRKVVIGRGFSRRGAIEGYGDPAMNLLQPLINFFKEEDGFQHLAVILIALVFCVVAHIYDKRKNH